MKTKKKNKILIAILVILFIIIGLFAGAYFYIRSVLSPTNAFLTGEICEKEAPCDTTAFVVDEGAYGKDTIDKLASMGIIKDSEIVYYYNRLFTGYTFPAGYFEIPHQIIDDEGNIHDITLDELLAFISDPGNAHQDTVTISFDEGGYIKEFAEKIGEATTLSAEEIFNYWTDENVVRSYMKEYPFLTEDIFNENIRYYLEGYLFPDTYEFFEHTSCDEVTRKFLDRTLEIYNQYEDDFKNSEFNTHEVFTLASIVQGETGNADDSLLIAGVFVDRLNAPEVLASSVTSCYAFDLSKKECNEIGEELRFTQKEDPYNTYTVMGLPPGPVCAPNEISINAALHPDTSEGYFYFCANYCDGGTVFARTFSEHQANIEKYMLACEN